jgi:methylmalonyl-CoA decarboxylase
MAMILWELNEDIGTITFNNDVKRNALNKILIDEFISALNKLREKKTRVVVVRAHPGAKVWSAGLDVTEFPEPGRDPISYYDPAERALRAIQHFHAPVIAMIEGSVWGAAVEFSLVCDVRIGTAAASFCLTPARLGIPYNPSGILHVINTVGMGMVKEMFFTAQPVKAERAAGAGLLNHLVSQEELEGFTYNLARIISRNAPLSISVIKEQLRLLANAMPLNPETFEHIQGLRRTVYGSRDYLEGQRAFLEKREPVFKGE